MSHKTAKNTYRSLLEQMHISEVEVAERKKLYQFDDKDARFLIEARPFILNFVDDVVEEFYELQTNFSEVELLISDSGTLERLKASQRRYVYELFGGVYDLDYVEGRLRIGLVHKRIGVDTKLYLSAVQSLKNVLDSLITTAIKDATLRQHVLDALDKLVMFDVSLVIDTYQHMLIAEIESSRRKAEKHALELEVRVAERTLELEEVSRTDPLTGLLNRRYLVESLLLAQRVAERRKEPLCLAYIDLNDFKQVNDLEGHYRGDEVLRHVGEAIRAVTRIEDSAFRYGGDEFCLVISNCTEKQAGEVFLPRLLSKLEELEPALEFSVGLIEWLVGSSEQPEEMLKEADRRMYEDKRERRSKRIHSVR